MKVGLTASGVLAVAGLGVAAYVAWKVSKLGGAAFDGIKQAAEQAKADVTSAWQNNIAAPFAQGQAYAETGAVPYKGEKAWLYSDYGYTGEEAGVMVADGEFYADAVARRYAYEQRMSGVMPDSYTDTPNGAAFGIYPKP